MKILPFYFKGHLIGYLACYRGKVWYSRTREEVIARALVSIINPYAYSPTR